MLLDDSYSDIGSGVDMSGVDTGGPSTLDYISTLGTLGISAYSAVSGQPAIVKTPTGTIYTGQTAVQRQQTTLIWGVVLIGIVAWLIFRK